MKKYCIFFGFAICVLFSCKKYEVVASNSYTMYVVNGSVGAPDLQVNPSSNTSKLSYTTAPQIAFGSRGIYYVRSNDNLTVVSATDTATYLVNKTFGFSDGVYSLFIIGQFPTVDTLIKAELDLPFIPSDKNYKNADSVVNVRFINLSPNSVPLRIKVSTATLNEVDNLAYKNVSTWRTFKATATTTYSLQIRNAATDVLITTYSFVANATNRFKNVTLIVKGLQGTTTGVNAFGMTPINYF